MNRWPHPALDRFRDHVLGIAPERLNTGWEDVLMPHGAALAGAAWGDAGLLEWAGRWADLHLAAGVQTVPDRGHGRPEAAAGFFLNDYCGHWGGPLALGPLCEAVPDATLHRQAMGVICDHIMQRARRLAGGVMAHGGGDYARESVWVDTMYYTAAVLAEGFRVLGDPGYAAEAVRQCRLHARWLRDPLTGCFFHDACPATGVRSQWLWSRGNGWAMLALTDTLRSAVATPGRDELLDCYRGLATGLLRWQQPCGLWRIVPELTESHLETSGSAMILAGLAAGIGEGWIERSAGQRVHAGYRELLTWIHPLTGALHGAQRPAGLGGWEAHKLSDLGECTYATGMLLRLLADLKRAGLLEAPPAELTDEQRHRPERTPGPDSEVAVQPKPPQ